MICKILLAYLEVFPVQSERKFLAWNSNNPPAELEQVSALALPLSWTSLTPWALHSPLGPMKSKQMDLSLGLIWAPTKHTSGLQGPHSDQLFHFWIQLFRGGKQEIHANPPSPLYLGFPPSSSKVMGIACLKLPCFCPHSRLHRPSSSGQGELLCSVPSAEQNDDHPQTPLAHQVFWKISH